jgi:hypothetical protein
MPYVARGVRVSVARTSTGLAGARELALGWNTAGVVVTAVAGDGNEITEHGERKEEVAEELGRMRRRSVTPFSPWGLPRRRGGGVR